MGLEKSQFNNKIFVSIVDGDIVAPSNENDPEAKKRIAINPRTREEKIKYEKHYHNLRGFITDLGFREVEGMGEFLFIEIDNVRLSLSTTSLYATYLMKFLPNVNFNIPVNLVPWRMEKDKAIKSGLVIYQNINQDEKNVKISNYFYDYKSEKTLNGMPEPDKECNQWDKDDWKIYFTRVKKFLVKYTKDNILQKAADQENIQKAAEPQEESSNLLNNSVRVDPEIEKVNAELEQMSLEDNPF